MKSPLASLRGRFLLSILLWVALGIGAIWFSSVRLFTVHVESQYHEELEVHVRELGGLTVLDTAGRPQLARPLSDPRYAEPLSGFYWQVTRPGFGALKSPSMTRGQLDSDVAHSPKILHRVADGPTGAVIVYGYIKEMPSGEPLHFVIATDERHLQHIVRKFTRELTVWLVLLALALLASGFAIITFGLRPLNHLSVAVERLRKGDIARIEGRYPDELHTLVSDLNTYVERNSEIVDRGRMQASALAHSLRTPLAVIVDEAEQLAEGRRPCAARTLLEQSERMQRQIDYHLARVRSGGTKAGVAENCCLTDVLAPILTAMARCYPKKNFRADVPDNKYVSMDGDDLNEVMGNVLDNAGKWSASQIFVTVDGADILVCDDGVGIAPDCRDQAFGIGETGASPLGGSGLGLAIARSIARDYGGDVTLTDSLSGGLCVRLTLP